MFFETCPRLEKPENKSPEILHSTCIYQTVDAVIGEQQQHHNLNCHTYAFETIRPQIQIEHILKSDLCQPYRDNIDDI